MWRPSDIFRFIITLSLLGVSAALLIIAAMNDSPLAGAVPQWLVALDGLAIGNTFRLQAKA